MSESLERDSQYLLEKAAQHVKAAITILRNVNILKKQPGTVPRKYWRGNTPSQPEEE